MKSKTKEWNIPKDFTHDDYFKLLNQYYSELKHRDGDCFKFCVNTKN